MIQFLGFVLSIISFALALNEKFKDVFVIVGSALLISQVFYFLLYTYALFFENKILKHDDKGSQMLMNMISISLAFVISTQFKEFFVNIYDTIVIFIKNV